MLNYNTMRFATDSFKLDRRALLVAQSPLDCSGFSSVNSITIGGSQPTGTDRRFMFKIDNALYKFNGSTLTAVTGDLTADFVLENGNSAAELTALSNITGFVGKAVYPIIALAAPLSGDVPSAAITLNATTSGAILDRYFYSSVYTLGDNVSILDVSTDIAITGNAACEVFCRLLQNDSWTDYMPYADAINQKADAIQFQWQSSVAAVNNSNAAKVVSISYSLSDGAFAAGNSDIFTILPNFDTNLRSCVVVVRHDALGDNSINAFVHFATAPEHITREPWGAADVKAGVIYSAGLGVAKINPDSIKVTADGEPFTAFSFDPATRRISCRAPADGVSFVVDFDYNMPDENWLPMSDKSTTPNRDGTLSTRFAYSLQNSNYVASAVRLSISRNSNSTTPIIHGFSVSWAP